MKRTFSGKHLGILIFMMGLFFTLTLALISLYLSGITVLTARWLQTGYYLLMAGLSLLAMKLSGFSFKEYGLFFHNPVWQLLVGFFIAAVFTMITVFATGGYTIPSDWLYLIPSQLLVGIAEELFWRGLLLKLMAELLHSKRAAVPLNALLFGLWHYPISRSLITVVLTAFIGLTFAVVRTEYDEEMGIPGLAFAHALMNIF